METDEADCERALCELEEAIAALSTPEAGAEVLRHIRDATEEAAREHDLVLNRSWEIGHAGVPFIPSYRESQEGRRQ